MHNPQILPEAFYDSISLAHKLDDYLSSFREEELHLFAYFSLLLFLYRKHSLNDWGYKFIVSESGYPYSKDLNDSIQKHIRNGIFEESENFFKITARGVDEFNRFKNMELFKQREDFLSVACTTSIAIPYRLMQKALYDEPELERARKMKDKRWIINKDDQHLAYKKFAEVSDKIGINVENLLIPAITWINYLSEKKEEDSECV